MVVWLIGISGAGKTTLGSKIKKYYDDNNIDSYIIDGDLVRDFYDNDLGYSKADRVSNIKRIMLSAYVLEQNNVIPIVCNISPFESLRNFARNKFDNYNEIYLKRNIADIKNKDDIYSSKNVVGVDFKFEVPLNTDLTIDTSVLNIQESFDNIIQYLNKGWHDDKYL